MSVIALTGTPGAPGTTSTALALLLSWPLAGQGRVLLAECDPDGGAVLAGALQGRVEATRGLHNLAVADRRGRLLESLWEQLVDIGRDGDARRLLLPGLTDPAQAPAMAYSWEPLARACRELEADGCDVLLDLGRTGATGPSAVLARSADVVAVVARTTLRGLSAARPRVDALRADLDAHGTGADALGLLLVEDGPYKAAEAARSLGVPVFGTLPYAAREARVLADGGDLGERRLARSELFRAVRSAADQLRGTVAQRRVRLTPAQPPSVAGQSGAVAGVPGPQPGTAAGASAQRPAAPAYRGPGATTPPPQARAAERQPTVPTAPTAQPAPTVATAQPAATPRQPDPRAAGAYPGTHQGAAQQPAGQPGAEQPTASARVHGLYTQPNPYARPAAAPIPQPYPGGASPSAEQGYPTGQFGQPQGHYPDGSTADRPAFRPALADPAAPAAAPGPAPQPSASAFESTSAGRLEPASVAFPPPAPAPAPAPTAVPPALPAAPADGVRPAGEVSRAR